MKEHMCLNPFCDGDWCEDGEDGDLGYLVEGDEIVVEETGTVVWEE